MNGQLLATLIFLNPSVLAPGPNTPEAFIGVATSGIVFYVAYGFAASSRLNRLVGTLNGQVFNSYEIAFAAVLTFCAVLARVHLWVLQDPLAATSGLQGWLTGIVVLLLGTVTSKVLGKAGLWFADFLPLVMAIIFCYCWAALAALEWIVANPRMPEAAGQCTLQLTKAQVAEHGVGPDALWRMVTQTETPLQAHNVLLLSFSVGALAGGWVGPLLRPRPGWAELGGAALSVRFVRQFAECLFEVMYFLLFPEQALGPALCPLKCFVRA